MKHRRRDTVAVKVGKVTVGGSAAVSVQSMARVPSAHLDALRAQVRGMISAGAELVRIAVRTKDEARAIPALKTTFDVPIIADIHYRGALALESIRQGADKVRINPGNMSRQDMQKVIAAARDARVAVRIGVNSGSVDIRGTLAASMVRAARDAISLCEDSGFRSLVISVKTPDVATNSECYRRLAEICPYPFHLGITEAGKGMMAEAKSVMGIGCLLREGIGDTVRVSLTAGPRREILLARAILQAAGLRRFEPEVISCPTCGRTRVDVAGVRDRVQRRLRSLARRDSRLSRLTVAVMGCSVNGPGEARQADVGIAGGEGKFALFRKGTIMGTYPEDEIVDILLEEIQRMVETGEE